MKPTEFFARHPVFTFEAFRVAHQSTGNRSPATTASVLKQHVAAGNLINVRRGLYARVPEGADAASFRVDPYLVASRLSTDAVVAHHSALQLLGKAHTPSPRVTYLSARRAKPFSFQDTDFVPVLVPAALRGLPDFGGGLREERRQGLVVRVTGYERTLVDVLDAPEHGGGWEEIWRSLESIECLDLDFIVEYTQRLGSALTAARVGFFLEQHQDEWQVEERHLEALRAWAPAQPRYLERRHCRGGKLLPRWNLIVPERLVARSWERPKGLPNRPPGVLFVREKTDPMSGSNLQPGRVYRTRDLAPWGANAPRLAKRLVARGELVPLAHGLFAHPRQSRFGPVPPRDEEIMRAFLGGGPFVFTGPERWNALGLGTTAVLAVPLVYNTKRSGTFTFGKRRFVLRRVAFPEDPPEEWFVVDLLEHADQAAASPDEIAQTLARALAHGKFDRHRLRDIAKRYGSRATFARVERALRESAS